MPKTPMIIILILLTLSQCGVDSSFKKTWSTGIIEHGNGLLCEDLVLNGNIQDSTITFIYGEQIEVEFKGIKGFNRIDNIRYPGMSITMLNSIGGDTLRYENDVFKKSTDEFSNEKLDLSATMIAHLEPSEKNFYEVCIRVWDKKGEGEYIVNIPFKVRSNDKLEVESNNCDYERIYLWDQSNNKAITNNIISQTDLTYLLFNGVTEFYIENDKVYPTANVRLTDYKDSTIIVIDREFKNGINFEEFSKQFYIEMLLDQGQAVNPATLSFQLSDSKSDAFIRGEIELEIKK